MGISPSTFLGRPTREVHEHRDGYTVVTRESEWTDRDRDEMVALCRYEAGLCECGFHRSQTTDPDFWWEFEDYTCPVCASGEVRGRVQAAEDQDEAKRLGENPAPTLPRESDGRRTGVRPATPAEIETAKARRASRPTRARQAPRG